MINYLARLRKLKIMNKTSIVTIVMLFLCWSALASSSKVDTFMTTPTSITMCEDVPGSGVSTFDLTSVQSDIVTIMPNMAFGWYADAGLSILIADPAAYTAGSSIVFAQVFSTIDTACKTTEQVTLTVLATPDLTYLDAVGDTICGRRPIRLGNPTGPDVIYQWVPVTNLSSDTVSNPTFTPESNVDDYSYTVTATSLDGMCMTVRTLNFKVLDADLDITYLGNAVDVVERCKEDDPIALVGTSSEDPTNIMWSASRDVLSDDMGETIVVTTEFATYVYAMQSFSNGCILYDTVLVRVDSLPEFKFDRVIPAPNEDCGKYCPGTTINLSTNPDPTCSPHTTYQWTPVSPIGDIVDADTNLNVTLQVTNGNTQLYTRTAVNHACMEIDTHTIFVVDTIPMIFGVPDKVCPGDEFDLNIDPDYLH